MIKKDIPLFSHSLLEWNSFILKISKMTFRHKPPVIEKIIFWTVNFIYFIIHDGCNFSADSSCQQVDKRRINLAMHASCCMRKQ